FSREVGLTYKFFDEDNALIPFWPAAMSNGLTNWFDSYHVVGGKNAVTATQGDAFRLLVAFEILLRTEVDSGRKHKDVFLGDNYTGEHPLKQARKFILAIQQL